MGLHKDTLRGTPWLLEMKVHLEIWILDNVIHGYILYSPIFTNDNYISKCRSIVYTIHGASGHLDVLT